MRFLGVAVALACAAGAHASVAAAADKKAASAEKKAAPKVLFKVATIAPEGSTWMKLMHEMDDRVRAETGNEAGFKFYPGGVQGDEALVLKKMRSGQLHGGGFTGNGLGVVAPSLRVMEIPFLIQNETELDAVHAAFDAEFEKALDASGHALLGWAEVGFIHLFTKKPVKSLPDLKSSKMWLWEGDPLPEALFQVAGVSPVPLGYTDVYTSLQTGLVEGVYCSPYACLVLQWHTQVTSMSEQPISHGIGAVIVTKEMWSKLTPDSQKKVRQIADDVFARLRTSTRADNKKALGDIKAAGIKTVPFDAAAIAEFRRIGDQAAEKCVGKLYSAELLARVRKTVADSRAAGAAPPAPAATPKKS
jgi:TRAP-type C4-dicarboxylate transport system substrate-binding protein